jgi:hypothetical protein
MARKKAAAAAEAKTVGVFSPNRQYTGITAGVSFVDGNGIIPADTENIHHLVGWFQDHGYTIGDAPAEADAEPDAEPDPSDVELPADDPSE